MDEKPVTVRVHESRVPSGLAHEVGATAGYTTLSGDSDGEPEARPTAPSLVARYSDEPSRQRWALVTRIDAGDAAGTLEAMTASHAWGTWPSAHESSQLMSEDGVDQVAWHESNVIVWIVSRGLDSSELRTFVDAVEVGE